MPVMTVGELIKQLQGYPPEFEVMIEVNNSEAWATDVDWTSGGISTWVTITDYPVKDDDVRRG